MSYPGGKAGAGVYQTIINLMPPHDLYIEAFVGGGAVLLKKRPAPASIVIDADADVAARWRKIAGRGRLAGVRVIHGDARSILADLVDEGPGRTLVYCDPPYVRSARRDSARAIYRREFTDRDHVELIEQLAALKAMVMLSGYRCALYDQHLKGWRRKDFAAMTRGGPAIESLWLNFAPPRALHDYGHLGANFRERERIKRKKARWCARLAAMPELERAAIRAALDALTSCDRTCAPASRRVTPPDPLAASGDAGSPIAANDDGGRHRQGRRGR